MCPCVAGLNFLTGAPPLRHPLRRVSRSDRPPRARPGRARSARRSRRTVRRPWEVPPLRGFHPFGCSAAARSGSGGGRARGRRAQDAPLADGAWRRSVPASFDRLDRCAGRGTHRERALGGRAKCQCLRPPAAAAGGCSPAAAAAPTPASERACPVRHRARQSTPRARKTGQSPEALSAPFYQGKPNRARFSLRNCTYASDSRCGAISPASTAASSERLRSPT